MEEKKRLRSNEYAALMHLMAAIEAIGSADALKDRIASIPKCKAMINGARGGLAKGTKAVLKSMPVEQVRSVQRQLKGLDYKLRIRNVSNADHRETGYWVSLESLNRICAATKDHCLMCQKNIEEQRRCPLAKALDELPCINADEGARGCRYYGGLY